MAEGGAGRVFSGGSSSCAKKDVPKPKPPVIYYFMDFVLEWGRRIFRLNERAARLQTEG